MSFLGRTFPKNIIQNYNRRAIHTTCACSRYYEANKKGGWRDWKEYEAREAEIKADNRRQWYGFKNGFKLVREEIVKWKDERYKQLTDESVWNVRDGDVEKFYTFNKPEDFKKWTTTTDATNKIGFSECEFILSPTGHGLFQGFVNAHVPRDGEVVRSGMCNIRSERVTKSFQRDSYHDWSQYTHFVMRCRGDGRTYMLNLATTGFFDLTWNDMYSYPVYTRGGPYWQYVKIPFNKFIFGSKGRIQDLQFHLPLHQIASVGITVAKVEGPFALEIDFIGVECDISDLNAMNEVHDYEMYTVPYGIVNV